LKLTRKFIKFVQVVKLDNKQRICKHRQKGMVLAQLLKLNVGSQAPSEKIFYENVAKMAILKNSKIFVFLHYDRLICRQAA
jgi:hypothetical protein